MKNQKLFFIIMCGSFGVPVHDYYHKYGANNCWTNQWANENIFLLHNFFRSEKISMARTLAHSITEKHIVMAK